MRKFDDDAWDDLDRQYGELIDAHWWAIACLLGALVVGLAVMIFR